MPAPKEPGRRAAPHPKPYEKDVQSAIRTLSTPVGGRDGACLLGFDGGELVAVALWSRMDDADDPLFKLRLMAVSRKVRGQGGAVARECLEEVLARIVAEVDEGDIATVYGLVDRRNAASQLLLTDNGFQVQEGAPVTDADLAMWALEVEAAAGE